MAAKMKHRGQEFDNIGQQSTFSGPDDRKYATKQKFLLSVKPWIVIFVLFIATYVSICFRNNHFPVAKTKRTALPGEFVEERARKYLKDITGFGPRTVGSYENEKLSVDYILKELNNIKNRAHDAHDIEIDRQVTSGSFTLGFIGGLNSVYENMNNLLVKVSPKGGAQNSLLVNCHYDSVAESPGASDDAVTCCLMLEVLNVITLNETTFPHNIIFIFNGAEENILQASHGFITQHPWAKSVRAFINLEAAGSGGRELLFQAGPENPWLIKAYADSVPHPFTAVFGQEIFQSGVIPSDTDFRIYRDFGNVPGLDIAYIKNGYVYHSRWDIEENISPGVVQRGGENLLALVKHLASSPLLPNPGEYKHGSLVFFDVLGLFVVHYPARVGFIINSLVVVLVCVAIVRKTIGHNTFTGLTGKRYLEYLVMGIGLHILSWFFILVAVALFAYAVSDGGKPMTWYTNSWLLFPLYVTPAVLFLCVFHFAAATKVLKNVGNAWDIEQVMFDGHMVLMTWILAALTFKGINSAVLFLELVASPLLIREGIAKLLKISGRENITMLLCIHLVGLFPPTLMSLYSSYTFFDMFVPLMGRIGTAIHPDIFLAVTCALGIILLFGYQVGFVYVTNISSMKLIIRGLATIAAAGVVLALFTPIGFPYKNHPVSPTKQRHIIHHLLRKFHDINGNVIRKDSGIMHLPFDYNGMNSIKNVPLVKLAKKMECEEAPYCGFPYYFPMIMIFKNVFMIEGVEPDPKPLPQLTLVNRTFTESDVERLTFSLDGPVHSNIYMMVHPGVNLVKWSIGNHAPMPTVTPVKHLRKDYFVYHSYGTKPQQPYIFWIELKEDKGIDRSKGVVEVALGGHWLQGEHKMTPFLQEYVDSMPNWTFPASWTATYENWIF